jgi:hypothetical protein
MLSVMWAVGIERRGERRRSYSTRALQYLVGTVYASERGRGPAARAVRSAGNAGRRASSTAGKREGFSF